MNYEDSHVLVRTLPFRAWKFYQKFHPYRFYKYVYIIYIFSMWKPLKTIKTYQTQVEIWWVGWAWWVWGELIHQDMKWKYARFTLVAYRYVQKKNGYLFIDQI